MRDLFGRLQIAFSGLTGRVADHAGGAAGEGDGVVAGELKAAEGKERHQVTDVQRIGGRVEAAIKRDRSRGQALRERVGVGAVGVQAAPLEFIEERHCGSGQ